MPKVLLTVNREGRCGCCSPYTAAVSTHEGPPRTYTYVEVADRVEQVLGVRPALSALRAAAAKARQSSTSQAAPRLTLGLPAPLQRPSGSGPARFAADEVERWLQEHPRRRWAEAMERARARLAAGVEAEEVVREALGQGLSWRNVAQLLHGVTGQPQTLAGVHKRYRHLQDSSDQEGRPG